MKIIYYFFIFYGILILFWCFLPDKFWSNLVNLLDRISDFVKNLRTRLPWLKLISNGQDLLLALSECESRLQMGVKILPQMLPQFKFYTSLILQLFEANRLKGVGIKKFIPEFRKAILKDIAFEKKVISEINGGILQCLLITFTTWGFVFLTKSMIEIKLDFGITVIMLLLEIFGIITFLKLTAFIKKKCFEIYGTLLSDLYLFNSLFEVGISVNDLIAQSKLIKGEIVLDSKFKMIQTRFEKLISRLKETGISPKEEVYEILNDVWSAQEEEFIRFNKTLTAIKFLILAFFYLPSYFLFLYSLFKIFMEQ